MIHSWKEFIYARKNICRWYKLKQNSNASQRKQTTTSCHQKCFAFFPKRQQRLRIMQEHILVEFVCGQHLCECVCKFVLIEPFNCSIWKEWNKNKNTSLVAQCLNLRHSVNTKSHILPYRIRANAFQCLCLRYRRFRL